MRDRRLTLGQGAAGRLSPGLLTVGLERRRQRLLQVERGLAPDAIARGLERRRERVERASRHLAAEGMASRLDRLGERLEARALRLQTVERRLTAEARSRLSALARTLGSLGPAQVLARGYAVVRDDSGAVVTGVAAADAAGRLEVEFADGRIWTRPERDGSTPPPRPKPGVKTPAAPHLEASKVVPPRKRRPRDDGDDGQGTLI